MEFLIDLGSGPLFRLCFALMLLGLVRIVFLTLMNMLEAIVKSDDRIVPWKTTLINTASWLMPLTKLLSKRPVYSLVSFTFHIGLILVPLFLAAHVLLWKESVGFGWFMLPKSYADNLSLLTIFCAIVLIVMRVFHNPARAISRKQDYSWMIILLVPFLTGYICANGAIGASTYQWFMLIHIMSGNMIMVMIPFTKIAHCVLIPFSQLVTGIGWKFPKGAGDNVIKTLGLTDRPSWVDQPRLNCEAIDAKTEKV